MAAAEAAARDLVERAAESARREAEIVHEQALSAQQATAVSAQRDAIQAREAELKRELDNKLASLHRANEDAMNRLRAEHTQDMSDAELAAKQFLADREEELVGRHESALAALKLEHQSTIAALTAEHQSTIAALTAEHQSAIASLTRGA